MSGSPRLLIADGDAAARNDIARLLRSAGYEVIESATAAATLDAALTADLLVLGERMADMDGSELRRRLRTRTMTARLPVLHLSRSFADGEVEVDLEAGCDACLVPPAAAPVLLNAVHNLLFARHVDFERRDLDAKFHTIFHLSPVAIAILDGKFRYESVNTAYAGLTGYPPEELVGQPGSSFLTSDSPDVDTRSVAAQRLRFEKKDGTLAEVEWQIAKQDLSGLRILVATDITSQVRSQEAQESLLASERAARSEAERSNRLKEEFLATLSHELRNPLNAILGWATVLNRKPGLPDAVMKGLQAIERNSRIQAQMISDLLDYAGISFGKMRLVAETVDPYPVVKGALDAMNASGQTQGVAIRATFGREPLLIEGDPSRLQQIVWNLLSNAVKFSAQGGQVELDVGRAGNSFSLVVTDHGRGIEPEFLPRIFERFSQQDATTTRSHGGLGLGLAIVKQLAELHGGSIHARSAGKGTGATFTVTIPLSSNLAEPSASDSQLLRALDFSGVTALVVEDDDDARELTRRILVDAGARVVEASSAEAALACVASSNANILVSDIGMAHQDGYQLLRQLRSMGYDAGRLPAIALTAFARMEDRMEALSAGFQEHLIKPLEPQLLIARVAALRPDQVAPV